MIELFPNNMRMFLTSLRPTSRVIRASRSDSTMRICSLHSHQDDRCNHARTRTRLRCSPVTQIQSSKCKNGRWKLTLEIGKMTIGCWHLSTLVDSIHWGHSHLKYGCCHMADRQFERLGNCWIRKTTRLSLKWIKLFFCYSLSLVSSLLINVKKVMRSAQDVIVSLLQSVHKSQAKILVFNSFQMHC